MPINEQQGAMNPEGHRKIADWMASWTAVRQSDLVHKISAVFGTQILRLVLSFIASVVIARILGPTNRGVFALAVATGALGVQFANLGLHTSNSYFAARDRKSLPFLLGNTVLVSVGVGAVISLAVWLFTDRGRTIGLPSHTMVLALAWIPIGLAYLLSQNLLLGVHNVSAFNIAEIVGKALPLILIGVLFLLRWQTVDTLFTAMLVGLCVSCVYVFRELWKASDAAPRISLLMMRENVGYAVRAYLAALFCFLVIRSDLFLIQMFSGMEQAGYYSIAVTLAETMSLLPASVAMVLLPRLTRSTDLGAKRRLTWRAFKITAIIMVPTFLIVGFLSHFIIVLLFGRAFERSSLAFVVLLPGVFFLGMHSVIVQLLNSIGYPKSVVYIWGLCAIVNIGANCFVIPQFGIVGASLTSTISYLLAFVLVAAVILSLRPSIKEQLMPEEAPAL